MGRTTVEVLTAEEAEEIAYYTAFLMQNGWKRTDKYRSKKLKQLTDKYNTELPNNVWIKEGHEHTVYMTDAETYRGENLTVPFFSLEDAYYEEENMQEKLLK